MTEMSYVNIKYVYIVLKYKADMVDNVGLSINTDTQIHQSLDGQISNTILVE